MGADGGHGSNSCNGGEDHPEGEGSQDDYDPFNEDGLGDTTGETETEFERNMFDQPGQSQRNGSTDKLESQDADFKIIDCNQDNGAVLRTDNAFLGGTTEKHHGNPLEEENSQTFIQSNPII